MAQEEEQRHARFEQMADKAPLRLASPLAAIRERIDRICVPTVTSSGASGSRLPKIEPPVEEWRVDYRLSTPARDYLTFNPFTTFLARGRGRKGYLMMPLLPAEPCPQISR